MNNFTFYNPTRIHFGVGQIEKIKSEIPADARVLVIYGGGSIKSNGVYDQVSSALSEHTWFEFSGIEPNPHYDTAMKALDVIKQHRIDYLLAVGGGSVIDATKFIAAAALIEEGPKVLRDKNNLDIRANIMWSATMALNGLIGVGVPQDWATHMIGHELTALHSIDHARTLSIVFPAVMKIKREQKREKLIQYGKRVWNLSGFDDEIINQAIDKTITFFQTMHVPTSLSDVNLGANDIDAILSKLKQHKMVALGEHRDIDLVVSREILEKAL